MSVHANVSDCVIDLNILDHCSQWMSVHVNVSDCVMDLNILDHCSQRMSAHVNVSGYVMDLNILDHCRSALVNDYGSLQQLFSNLSKVGASLELFHQILFPPALLCH